MARESSHISPPATLWMASTSWAGGLCFRNSPEAPASKARRVPRVVHPGDHQDSTLEAASLAFFEESRALFVSEVVIEEHHVHGLAVQHRQGIADTGASRGDAEIRLCFEQPAEALPKQAVIVDQQNPDCMFH